MTTYEVLVSDELLPEFTSDNPRMPKGFRVLGRVENRAGHGQTRLRVEDDNAPAWTEGKLITPTLQSHHGPDGEISEITVRDWREEQIR